MILPYRVDVLGGTTVHNSSLILDLSALHFARYPDRLRILGSRAARVFGIIRRVFDDGLQVVDGGIDGQPLAVGHGLRDDAASSAYVFWHRASQPQLVRFAQRISLRIRVTSVESRKRPNIAKFDFASSRIGVTTIPESSARPAPSKPDQNIRYGGDQPQLAPFLLRGVIGAEIDRPGRRAVVGQPGGEV